MPDSRLDTEHFRKRLYAERERLLKQEERLKAGGLGHSARDSIQELSMYDNHPGDIGDETYERSKDLSTVALLEGRRREIDQALARIRAGAYGRCIRCGRAIARNRLEAVPETAYCLECRRAVEADQAVQAGGRDPDGRVAAGGLRPSPGEEADLDDGDSARFDRDDAWQMVARYGTSSESARIEDEREE